MPKLECHVFICCNERKPDHPRGCCAARGGEAVRSAFKTELQRLGLGGRVRANLAGCLDQCEHGVVVVVYPEQVWYGFVQVADVAEIVAEHLVAGRPVARLMLPEGCINSATCPHRPAG